MRSFPILSNTSLSLNHLIWLSTEVVLISKIFAKLCPVILGEKYNKKSKERRFSPNFLPTLYPTYTVLFDILLQLYPTFLPTFHSRRQLHYTLHPTFLPTFSVRSSHQVRVHQSDSQFRFCQYYSSKRILLLLHFYRSHKQLHASPVAFKK